MGRHSQFLQGAPESKRYADAMGEHIRPCSSRRGAAPGATVDESHFSAQRAHRVSTETAVIAYVAEASVEGNETAYVAHCSSTYVRVRGSWLLVAHQRDDVQLWTDRRAQLAALSLFLTAADEMPRRVLRRAGG